MSPRGEGSAMSKVGRNERCPCGSGKKYKQCCLLANQAEASFSLEERANALHALAEFCDAHLDDERADAEDELWGDLLDRAEELEEHWLEASDAVLDAWFWFDRPMADGRPPVDAFLASRHGLGVAEVTWLTRMRESCMRLYEVVDARPGVSVVLRDVLGGTQVPISERTMSRTVRRGDALAARVIRAGASGKPELEISLIAIPGLIRRQVTDQLARWRDEALRTEPAVPETKFWKDIPPYFHAAWVSAILDPPMPELRNTDGEAMVLTRVRFAVVDERAMIAALDAADALDPDGDGGWSWSTRDGRPQPISLGTLRRDADQLFLEANSVERGTRGRALIESVAGHAVRFVAASHEDPTESIRDALRSGDAGDPSRPEPGAIPADVAEELTLAHYARHYRSWVDEPVPALGGATPRAAAARPALRDKVIELVRALEGMYQESLRRRQPAYDPSWMWEELGLAAAHPDHPPALAHERLAEAHPGLLEATRAVAARVRARPDFDDRSSRSGAADFTVDLGVRRLLSDDPSMSLVIPWLTDFEVHRRKTFWVDRALAWQLGQTELEITAGDLRLPFVSFAIAFTDRLALSLAERLVAATRPASPIAGHFAQVVTVYVTSEAGGLRLRFAVDPLGSDPPEIILHNVALDGTIRGVPSDKTPPPLPGLVHLVLSAILYATSPGIEPQVRKSPGMGRQASAPRREGYTSDEVWFLPGAIDISRLRKMQELERAPGGQQLLHRFLVRGHWRRPNPTWKDQSLRWVEPYWKGPELGAVIEKAYKLKP